MTEQEQAVLNEQALADARVVDEAHAIECARCEIELGEGRFKCSRAKGTDLCLDCALEMDGPEPDMNPDNLPSEMHYRDAMIDAGRGHLLT